MNDVPKIFMDENQTCRFDFTKARWATDRLNMVYHEAKLDLLSDVDFLVETENEFLFVEYKNASHPSVLHSDRFDFKKDSLIHKLVRKFYDSCHFCYAMELGIDKKKTYVIILEFPYADAASRKYVRNRVTALLPFLLQKQNPQMHKLIHGVDVLSVEEWNQKYPGFTAEIL